MKFLRRGVILTAILVPILFKADLAEASEAEMALQSSRSTDRLQELERTCFQTAHPYDPIIDIKSDVAIVYGISPDLGSRIEGWRREGYLIHLMTGISWGGYQDYLYGQFDGIDHLDEAQTDRNGGRISHGGDVYYMCPTEDFARYLAEKTKRAADAGILAIHMEEPEFWVRAGYSPAFKREWKALYGEGWIAPHSSPDAQYRASKLKYHLYHRTLSYVFKVLKEYSRQRGFEVRTYVPTHSLLNYAHWRIVSPERSLAEIPDCDGYIAQVWTGTARTPNFYRGVMRERTFETAFLEYGAVLNLAMTRGQRIWFLADPVEDNPNHTWDDYRRNWEATLVASLLWPQVWRYEVMPWPHRIFAGRYPGSGGRKRERIPSEYATEIMAVISSLNDMDQGDVRWDAGTQGVGVFISDTMMFQRGEPEPGDDQLGDFYGIALPLLKAGLPVHPVQLENVLAENYLAPYRILFLTYEGMKPMDPEYHSAIAKWIRSGCVLIYIGDDSDPYNGVREWWNRPPMAYRNPREHLFERLGLPPDAAGGRFRIGDGALIYLRRRPADLARDPGGADAVLNLAKEAAEILGIRWKESNAIVLRRGPYLIAAGLEESISEDPVEIEGMWADLFDHRLPVVFNPKVRPGQHRLMVNLDAFRAPCVVASASKVSDEALKGGKFVFRSEGPEGTVCSTRIKLRKGPAGIVVEGLGADGFTADWDEGSKTLLIRYPNSDKGRWVEVDVGR